MNKETLNKLKDLRDRLKQTPIAVWADYYEVVANVINDAERTTSPVSQMTDERIMEIAAPHLRIDITDMSEEWLQDCRTKFIATVRAILAAAAPQAQAVEPVADPRPLFDRKLSDLQQRGYEVIGRILHKDGEYALFDSSCRWLTKPQYWRLMHEQDGSLFATPPAAQPQPVAEQGKLPPLDALKPFAAIADFYAEQEDDSFEIWKDMHLPETRITLGQCRAARAAIASSQQAAEPKPFGWVQFIDGVQTQNFARTEKELATVKAMVATMRVPGKVEYVPVYAAPAIQQPQDELLDAEIDDMCSEAGMQTVFGYHRFIATRQDIRNLLKAALAKKGGAA